MYKYIYCVLNSMEICYNVLSSFTSEPLFFIKVIDKPKQLMWEQIHFYRLQPLHVLACDPKSNHSAKSDEIHIYNIRSADKIYLNVAVQTQSKDVLSTELLFFGTYWKTTPVTVENLSQLKQKFTFATDKKHYQVTTHANSFHQHVYVFNVISLFFIV